jgi:dihydroneopterin aldolase
MNSEMQIHLSNVKIYGYHGLDVGEDILGGEFEVNLTALFIPERVPVSELKETVDYTVLLEIVKSRMQKPALLLETLATEIASEIIAKFLNVTSVTISISKLHPPIRSFTGSVGVTFTLKRE